jgi:hypothetical protein
VGPATGEAEVQVTLPVFGGLVVCAGLTMYLPARPVALRAVLNTHFGINLEFTLDGYGKIQGG